MTNKYCIVGIVAIFASLLIVSSATAVPYTHSNAVGQETEILDKIEKIIKSKQFGNLRLIAEKNIDEEMRCEIRNKIIESLSNMGIQSSGSEFVIEGFEKPLIETSLCP